MREGVGGPAFGPWLPFDPIAEVHEAILSYAEAHPGEFLDERG